MYGVSISVNAKVIEPNSHILLEWPGYSAPTKVEWRFIARPDNTTFVIITESGYTGDQNTVASQAIHSTERFTLVLAGAKDWLEQNILLNLIADHAPSVTAVIKRASKRRCTSCGVLSRPVFHQMLFGPANQLPAIGLTFLHNLRNVGVTCHFLQDTLRGSSYNTDVLRTTCLFACYGATHLSFTQTKRRYHV